MIYAKLEPSRSNCGQSASNVENFCFARGGMDEDGEAGRSPSTKSSRLKHLCHKALEPYA